MVAAPKYKLVTSQSAIIDFFGKSSKYYSIKKGLEKTISETHSACFGRPP